MLERTLHGEVLELRLARPPANALSAALLIALDEALASAETDGAAAVILSGAPGMFSGGMDVLELTQADRDAVARHWQALFSVCARLATSPLPVAAAITGHAPAGGAVLAIHCDYRVMADGPFRIGLNEVAVGLFVPAIIQQALARLTGPYRAERLIVSGAMLPPVEAQACGMVDEIAPPEQVLSRSLDFLNGLLKLPRQAMRRTRASARADLAARYGAPGSLDLRPFLEAYFEAETQAVMRGLAARLKGKG